MYKKLWKIDQHSHKYTHCNRNQLTCTYIFLTHCFLNCLHLLHNFNISSVDIDIHVTGRFLRHCVNFVELTRGHLQNTQSKTSIECTCTYFLKRTSSFKKFIFILLTKLGGGIGITMSVCPSVCPTFMSDSKLFWEDTCIPVKLPVTQGWPWWGHWPRLRSLHCIT